MLFPSGPGARTRLVVAPDADASRLPVIRWVGVLDADGDGDGEVADGRPGAALLLEHSIGFFGRPGLRGHRLTGDGSSTRDIAGRDWSTAFVTVSVQAQDSVLLIGAVDTDAGLGLRTEVHALTGGALRIRHVLTNRRDQPYVLEGLEVSVPVPDSCTEQHDFTGRHMGERSLQRREIADGVWLRESRGGRPGLGSALMVVAAEPDVRFGSGRAVAVSVASSGNSVLVAQRHPGAATTLGGGELLLPGEIVLAGDDSYTSPWLFVVATEDGLDGIAASLHAWQRSLPAHPELQPVTLNSWEAVYFEHDRDTLLDLVDRAARVGVERFVLDDGWFLGRRDDRAGLGDWTVDPAVWPNGLWPLVERVKSHDMQFGLWFEPEMVNPDSDLYRAHPDWALGASERVPLLHRNQLVLDLTIEAAWQHVHRQIDELLATYPIDYVKWDHNRDLLEAGSRHHGGAPAAHLQDAAFNRLLDALRADHPHVAFESCASGGGRIDLNVVEHVQRFWTSDQTDALARHGIQRWSAQLIAPEYLGAHVSSTASHHTGRTLPLDFRAATALFGAFGIEWNLGEATEAELERLAAWVRTHQEWRPVLHSGRMVRIDVPDPAVLAHGVVATDRRTALFAHVQLDESASERGVILRLPGLDPHAHYTCEWVMPDHAVAVAGSPSLDPAGPTHGARVRGSDLGRSGLWLPRQRPETVRLIAVRLMHASDSDARTGDRAHRDPSCTHVPR